MGLLRNSDGVTYSLVDKFLTDYNGDTVGYCQITICIDSNLQSWFKDTVHSSSK